MSADEFIEQYGKIELLKMMKAQQSAADCDDFQAQGIETNNTKAMGANQFQNRTSNTQGEYGHDPQDMDRIQIGAGNKQHDREQDNGGGGCC